MRLAKIYNKREREREIEIEIERGGEKNCQENECDGGVTKKKQEKKKTYPDVSALLL